MNLSWTLFRYIARQFLASVGFVFLFCLTLAFVIICIAVMMPSRPNGVLNQGIPA